jgi:hypothetical protein
MKPILKSIVFLAVSNFQYGLSTGYIQSREERTTKHSHNRKKKKKET